LEAARHHSADAVASPTQSYAFGEGSVRGKGQPDGGSSYRSLQNQDCRVHSGAIGCGRVSDDGDDVTPLAQHRGGTTEVVRPYDHVESSN
jgi:hypothetical protein